MRLVRRISIASLVVSVATLALVLVMFVGDRWESAEDTQNFTEDEVEKLVRDAVGKTDCFEQDLWLEIGYRPGVVYFGFNKPTITIEHSFKPNGLWLTEVTTVWDLESEYEGWRENHAERPLTIIGFDIGFDPIKTYLDYDHPNYEDQSSATFNDDKDKVERKCIYRVNDYTGDVSSFR